MKEITYYEFQVPDFLLSALFNGDLSGLEDEDVKLFEEAEKCFNSLMEENKGSSYILSIANNEDGGEQIDPYFTHSPDFCNLACNVFDCELHIYE